MKLLPLNRQHNRDLFDCGEENLNTFFRCYASQCVRNRDCSCYVLTDDPLDQIPLGYFTLSSFCISRTLLSAMKIRSGYTHIPVTLLGRLAVDIKIQGKRVGHYLLNSALLLAEESPVASHGVYVQPKNSRAAEFYRSAGFLDLESNSSNPSYSMFFAFRRKTLN